MKKLIAMLLAVMLCISAFPLSALAITNPQEKYITYIAISKDRNSADAKIALNKEGYFPLRDMYISSAELVRGSITDLNEGAGGKYIYMGIKKGDDYAYAIKGIVFLELSQSTEPPDSLPYGGVTFYLVGGQYEPDPVSGEPVNLNEGAGGKYIYTYITRDGHYNGGRPIINMLIEAVDDGQEVYAEYVPGNTESSEKQDLNAGTKKHKKCVYMVCLLGSHEHTYSDLVPAQKEIHTQQQLTPSVAAHYRCEVCQKYFDENKQETTLAKLTGKTPQHSYGNWTIVDDVHHKGQCTVCGLETELLVHVYDDENDAECNDCGYMRQLCDHTFSEEWSYNEYNHWHDATCEHYKTVISGWAKHYGGTATCTEQAICAACKQPYDPLAEHTYGDLIPAQPEVHTTTELKAAVAAHYQCSVCHKYFTEDKVETTLQALTGTMPQHSYSETWVNTDPDWHWKACSCGLKSEEAEHEYDNVLDADCNVCGYVREITHVHTYAEEWSYNEYKHWHDATCEHETLMSGWGSHVFTDLIPAQSAVHTATELKPSVAAHYQCSVCLVYFDVNKNPTTLEALTGTMPQHSYSGWVSTDPDKHWQECSCGKKEYLGGHVFDGEQDTDCNTCGYVRTVHSFGNLIAAQPEVHTPTELKAAVAAHYYCSDCQTYFTESKVATTLEALTGTMPQHRYSGWVSTDPDQHWQECSCGRKEYTGTHFYDDDQDATCDTCGHVRTVDQGGQGDQSTCIITFNANGGTGTMNPQTVTKGVEQKLNENQFTYDGGNFVEWNTDAEGNGDAYDDGAAITVSSNITLYAQWRKIHSGNKIVFTKQPTDQSVMEGQRAQFSIEASGDGLSYQWYINRNDGLGWKEVIGATENTYVTSVTELANDGFQYRCLVIDEHKNRAISDMAVLHVSSIPAVPETGDSSTPLLWLAMCVLSLAGIVLVRKKSYGK